MRMRKFKDKINNLLNKDVTVFLNKYKLPLISMTIMALLACIGMIVSYAFYQVVEQTPIIGGTTGKIADLDVRIMAEERDTNGIGLNSYAIYPYIPKAGYKYNAEKSYCTNGSVINYDSNNYRADITAQGHDVCYLYFDSTAVLDITLNVYAENVDSNGDGTGEYTKLETTALPSIGYKFNESKSSCKNGSTVTYSADENMFTVEALKKDVCVAYMDALEVDIALKMYVQDAAGSTSYLETSKVPKDAFYTLSSQSACTGSSTISMNNQRVVIGATSKTNCVAYLDISSGPILESMLTSTDNTNVTVVLTNSSVGSTPTTYYYSSDNGVTYVSTTNSTYTFSNLSNIDSSVFKAYAVDSAGNKSGILSTTVTNNYVYNGLFAYQNTKYTKNIDITGYYKLEVWGAEGGSGNTYTQGGGAGGYSSGTIYLESGTNLNIYVGGKGSASTVGSTTRSGAGFNANAAGVTDAATGANGAGGGGGATDIRIESDDLSSRVIVAGGGGGKCGLATLESCYGGAAGGLKGQTGYYNTTPNNLTFAGQGGTQLAGGATGTIADYQGSSGGFGYGGYGGVKSSDSADLGAGAGGGGWFGGGGGTYRYAGGGGGSGFVYTSPNVNCTLDTKYFMKNTSLIGGNEEFLSPSGITKTGNLGNGFAKITYLGASI